MNIEAKYIVPIETAVHGVNITQGFKGPWSHFDQRQVYNNHVDLTYAVDFGLPFGSIVIAAREGIIEHIWGESEEFYEGSDPEIGNKLQGTNSIMIDHQDGTMSVYSHLAKHSSRVKWGQKIKSGQELARTGKSGWIAQTPHLHFHVEIGKGDLRTLPIAFINYTGPLIHSLIEEAHSEMRNTIEGLEVPNSLIRDILSISP